MLNTLKQLHTTYVKIISTNTCQTTITKIRTPNTWDFYKHNKPKFTKIHWKFGTFFFNGQYLVHRRLKRV